MARPLAPRPLAPEHCWQQLGTIGIDRPLLGSVEIGVFVVVADEGGDISNGGGQLREHWTSETRTYAGRLLARFLVCTPQSTHVIKDHH
jgi:hypothetical protein